MIRNTAPPTPPPVKLVEIPGPVCLQHPHWCECEMCIHERAEDDDPTLWEDDGDGRGSW